MSIQNHVRVFFGQDGEVAEDLRGRFFLDNGSGRISDLSSVRLLRCGVDTVRQLYTGSVKPEVLALFGDTAEVITFAGERFHASRVGRDSGYQFKLQNADLGFVLLLKNFNVKVDCPGPHLKIEVSPHAIDSCEPQKLQSMMDAFADLILVDAVPRQCAVHLALDFQGWTPPVDFVDRMHCKARAQRRFDGVLSFEFDEKTATYGRGQSFLFGSAGALQLGFYNKSLQAKSIDKLDYWEHVWSRYDNPFDAEDPANYDPAQPVWRCEFRYHHSVVEQFSQGSCCARTGQQIGTQTYAELASHLDGLWQYGLKTFRFLERPTLWDPLWQLFMQDVRVETGVTSLLDETEYRRYYKTSSGFSGKNIDLMVGNAISLAARQRLDARQTFKAIRSLPFWPLIRDYYMDKGISPQLLRIIVRDRLEERLIRWGVAV